MDRHPAEHLHRLQRMVFTFSVTILDYSQASFLCDCLFVFQGSKPRDTMTCQSPWRQLSVLCLGTLYIPLKSLSHGTDGFPQLYSVSRSANFAVPLGNLKGPDMHMNSLQDWFILAVCVSGWGSLPK